MKDLDFRLALPLAAIALSVCSLRGEGIDARGLDLFFELGLPDTRGAAWVQAMPAGGDVRTASRWMYARVQGNAWLLKKHADGTADIVLDQARLLRVGVAGPEGSATSSEYPPFALREVSLDEDLARLRTAIAGAKTSAAHSRRYYSFPSGEALLMTAHLRRQGREAEVRQLLPELMQTDVPENVISSAIGMLADAELAQAAGRWVKGGDPAGYARELDALGDKYAQGWKNRDAVALLAGNVRDQKAGRRAGEAGARAAANWLLELTSAQWAELAIDANWLLPEGGDQETSPTVAAFTRQLANAPGADALAALLDDGRMLRALKQPDFVYDSDDEDAGPAARRRDLSRRYQALGRPITVGEAAGRLLEPVLPDSHRQAIAEDRAAAMPLVSGWLAEIESLQAEELAWQILKGSESPSNTDFRRALGWLVRNGGAESLEQLKTVFLDPKFWESPYSVDAGVLGAFLQRLRSSGDAKAFEDKLLGALQAAIRIQAAQRIASDSAGPGGGEERTAEIERELRMAFRQIEQVIRPRSLTELLAELVAAKDDEVDGLVQAIQAAAHEAADAQSAYFVAAAASDSPAKQFAIILSLSMALMGTPEQTPVELRPDALKAVEKLLNSNEMFQPEGFSEILSIAEQTAAIFAWPRLSADDRAHLQGIAPYGNVAQRALMARAKAIVAGSEAPPWPDDSRLPKSAAESLIQRLASLAPPEVVQTFEGFTPDEQLAVARRLKEMEKWPDALSAARLTVTRVAGNAAGGLGGQRWLNRVLDHALIEEMEGALAEGQLKGQAIRAALRPAQATFGMCLVAQRPNSETMDAEGLGIELPQGSPKPVGLLVREVTAGEKMAVDYAPIGKEGDADAKWRKDHPLRLQPRDAGEQPSAQKLLEAILSGGARSTFGVVWQTCILGEPPSSDLE